MLKYAIYVHMTVKPGQEKAAEEFLRSAESLVREETKTVGWFAFRESPTSYGLFDVFEEDADRKTHIAGKVAAALMAKAPELFTQSPEIHMIDLLASKIPGDSMLPGDSKLKDAA